MSASFTNQVLAQIELWTKGDRLQARRLHPAQASGRKGRPPASGRIGVKLTELRPIRPTISA
jgi:adenosylhomocysteinase